MPLPCRHDESDPQPDCKLCQAFATEPAFRVMLSEGGLAKLAGPRPVAPPPRPRCAHLGAPTGEVEDCSTCVKKTRFKVHACTRHTVCVLGRSIRGVPGCDGCPDYEPLAASRFPVRDLAYHLCPVAGNGVWQRNVEHLLKRWHLFTGKKLVVVVTGNVLCDRDDGHKEVRPLDPPQMVYDAFRGRRVEFATWPNNPDLREAGTMVPLLERLESREPGRAVFYAHAKGVTRPVNPGVTVHPWTDILYESLLDYWPVVEGVLTGHPIAGTFKKLGHGFEGSYSTWHYSGSFFWARSADLFSRDWRRIDSRWWGNEAWPGLHYQPGEAGCVFHSGYVGETDLYSMDYLNRVVRPAWGRWRLDHAGKRTVGV